jgi:hypothetical protein
MIYSSFFYGLVDDLINNPNWYKDFDDIIQEPGRFWDILKQGTFTQNSAFGKWGQGKFTKDLWEDASKFESTVVTHFAGSYSLDNELAEQITIDVYKNTEKQTIRMDILLKKNTNNKVNMVEAKFSRADKDWFLNWEEAATDNQKIVYNWLKNNEATKVVIKATDIDKVNKLRDMGIIISNGQAEITLNNLSLTLFGSKAGVQEIKSIIILKP